MKDGRIEELKDIYGELNEDKKLAMEQIATGLLDVQTIMENNRPEELKLNNEKLV